MTAGQAGHWTPWADETSADLQRFASAMLNILEDAEDERLKLEATQKAILNILEDAAEDRSEMQDTQRAVLNILDDSSGDRQQIEDTQRAVINILEDFDAENRKVELANAELRYEVAERARSEQALRNAKAAIEKVNLELDTFSYSVAHDLRAPLRSIDGFSQALIEDCADSLDEQGKTYLGYVRDSAQHMARLIDDLLSLSRVSRAEFVRRPSDLAEIARTVVTALRRSERNRTVEFAAPDTIPAMGDARLLGIALGNLLGNAWKFTSKTADARIELGVEESADGPVYYIRDNGAGFDMAYAEKLFAVFQRLHGPSEFDGTGIGLATVQRIIQRHDGRIWAEGAVGRGATFFFTLGTNS